MQTRPLSGALQASGRSSVRRDDQLVAVSRAGIDGVHHLVGRPIDHRHDRPVLAGDVDESVGPELERVRRDIGAQIDGGRMPTMSLKT